VKRVYSVELFVNEVACKTGQKGGQISVQTLTIMVSAKTWTAVLFYRDLDSSFLGCAT